MCELSTNGKLWWCHVHLCFTGGCESIHHKVETLEEYAPECAHMYSRMIYNCIYLSIYHLSTDLPFYLSTCLSIHVPIYPSNYAKKKGTGYFQCVFANMVLQLTG